jgi:menaquinone-9 beta-reductase
MATYDLITVGGGLGGAALAYAMAEHGARVLVLERETQFKDRVRGEGITPWGVEEARQLGIYDMLLASCGHELKYANTRFGSLQLPLRDLVETTSYRVPELSFYHPAMQEALLASAGAKGAEIRRGAAVTFVEGGQPPTVTVETARSKEQFHSRLVAGADGRSSRMRQWGGFEVLHDPERNIVCGLLMENMAAPLDTLQWLIRPETGEGVVIFPQGDCARAYFLYQHTEPYRLSGQDDIPRFIEKSVSIAPPEFYEKAKPVGPLASFGGADSWVEHPYRDGVVLIGDAAGASDPTYGQGLEVTLLDARVLRDHLLANDDWNKAADGYASEHAKYYGTIHTVENWLSELLMSIGPGADSRRDRALSLIAEDPTRFPDHIISGPELPADEQVRRRLFGEI